MEKRKAELKGRTVVCGDAVVVDHAAGVEGVAGLLARAAAVQDAAVLAVPQQRRDFGGERARRSWATEKANACQLLNFTNSSSRNCGVTNSRFWRMELLY